LTEPNLPSRTYRIGIDVGGTFTKAVLIDNATHEVVGRFSVLTTHSDPRGVAKGVVDVFRNVLEKSGVDPKEVIFLAHSTTQATNALLEGDVASVGVIGMSTRMESLLAKSQSAMKPIELAPGRYLTPANRFLTKETLNDETIGQAIGELKALRKRRVPFSISPPTRLSPWSTISSPNTGSIAIRRCSSVRAAAQQP
jgi:N-methylhydantoinase A